MAVVVTTQYDDVWRELFGKRASLSDRRAELEAELSEVSNQITHLNEILRHLRPLAGIPTAGDITSMGITDAVRLILSEATERLAPTEVRDKLVERGFDVSALTAPMASIYKILGRLADASTPEVSRTKDEGKVYYEWIQRDDDIPF